jgi:hypothetical protein
MRSSSVSPIDLIARRLSHHQHGQAAPSHIPVRITASLRSTRSVARAVRRNQTSALAAFYRKREGWHSLSMERPLSPIVAGGAPSNGTGTAEGSGSQPEEDGFPEDLFRAPPTSKR